MDVYKHTQCSIACCRQFALCTYTCIHTTYGTCSIDRGLLGGYTGVYHRLRRLKHGRIIKDMITSSKELTLELRPANEGASVDRPAFGEYPSFVMYVAAIHMYVYRVVFESWLRYKLYTINS